MHGDVPMRGVGVGGKPRKLQLDAVEMVAGGRRPAPGFGREPQPEEREPEPAPKPISPPQSQPAAPAQQQVEAALDHRDTTWVDTIIEQQLADLASTGHHRRGQRRARQVDSSWQSLCAQRLHLGIGSTLTEIYLWHACSDHEMEDGNRCPQRPLCQCARLSLVMYVSDRDTSRRVGARLSRAPVSHSCGESFLRVHWVAVPKALRARRVNKGPGVVAVLLCMRRQPSVGALGSQAEVLCLLVDLLGTKSRLAIGSAAATEHGGGGGGATPTKAEILAAWRAVGVSRP
eukprot:COSAG01_NODE_5357_length_4313_cov_1.870195_1_plen_288_part_00